MKHVISTLDVAFSPADEFLFTMAEGGWIIAVAALLVIGAIVGIIIFNKNKKSK